MNTHEIIMGVVSTMPIEKMYEILGQLKTICTQNREQARELFATHPHLALAVMRMQVTHICILLHAERHNRAVS